MNKSIKLIAFSLAVLTLSACSPKRESIPLSVNLQQSITSSDAYIQDNQKEIIPEIHVSNLTAATGGGLIVALVDSGINSYRESCAKEAKVKIDQQFSRYDFQNKINKVLEKTMKSSDWLHVKQAKVINLYEPNKLESALAENKSDVVLTCQVVYNLSPNFTAIKGTLHINLYPVSEKLKKLAEASDSVNNPIFKTKMIATSSLPSGMGEDITQRGEIWANKDGWYLRQALDNINTQLSDQLAHRLRHPNHLPKA